MMNIKDIARLAGVSPSTVSRVVNGKKYVKPELRERILDLVRETGYVPNVAARSMVLKRTFTVGIVVPDAFNMFQRQLFSAIERRLEGYGYRTRFFLAKADAESERDCLARLRAEMLDGVIMLHEVEDPGFYEALGRSGVPLVLCTFNRAGSGLPSVHIDEEDAAKAATGHLLALGHRRIGLLAGAQFSFGRQRQAGYEAALAEAGIAAAPERVAVVPVYTAEAGRAGMAELLARGLDLTAIFAVTDELAVGAIRALYEAGLRTPEDMSVIGFDDIDISASLSPSLSTVRQPISDIGTEAAELIFRLISGEPPLAGPHILPFSLLPRETTRPLSAERRLPEDSRS
jgi:LacI family transcriptional regulator